MKSLTFGLMSALRILFQINPVWEVSQVEAVFFMVAAEHQCKNITEDEAPRHGGMVCHWFNEQSSIFCNVRCNPGFEHPAKVNDYETCGPTTGFEWSFRIKKNDPDATFPSCVGKKRISTHCGLVA